MKIVILDVVNTAQMAVKSSENVEHNSKTAITRKEKFRKHLTINVIYANV